MVIFVLLDRRIGLVDCSCVTKGEIFARGRPPLLLSPFIPIDSLHPIISLTGNLKYYKNLSTFSLEYTINIAVVRDMINPTNFGIHKAFSSYARK